MLKAAVIVVVVAMAAGCAGNARPTEPTDVPVRDDVPAGMRGETETGGVAELPTEAVPAATRADLEPMPLPEGVRPDDFDIALQYNRRIAYWLEYYQKYHTTFGSWLERMSRYEPLIRGELTQAGLPGDLIYLALIESGFTPNATSRARAVGIWQFMRETARDAGLEVSTYVDERRDPVKATAAAVRHLRSLYRELGSWYLVAAAYNSGSGRVLRALDANASGARGADSLFWSIEPVLPRETRDYVPQFVAASILGKYADRFGVAPQSLPGPDDYESVRISQATDLAAIARAARVPEDAVRRLNPQFYLGVTPPGRTVSVRVPAGSADRVQERLAAMPRRQRVHDLRHTVGPDETVKEVASTYGVELAALRKANHLKKKTRVLAEGRVLIIPLVPASVLAREGASGEEAVARSASRERNGGSTAAADAAGSRREASAERGRHAAEGAAERPVAQDAAEGDSSAPAGRTVARRRGAAAGDSERESTASARTYRVKRGDTLSEIAAANDLSVAELRALNSLKKGVVLQPGRVLRLGPRSPDATGDASTGDRLVSADAPAHAAAPRKTTAGRGEQVAARDKATREKAPSRAGARRTYRVKAGDTLWHIAEEHNMSVQRLRALNGMDEDAVLQPGQTLKVGDRS